MDCRNRIVVFCGLVLAGSAFHACAATSSGFYADVIIGQSRFDSETAAFVDAIPIRQTARNWLDKTGTMWALGVGYSFNRFISASVDYYDFGRASYQEQSVSSYRLTPTVSADISAEGQVRGAAVGVRGSLPVYGWIFFAEVKALMATTRLSGTVVISSVGPISTVPVVSTAPYVESTNSTKPLYGIGADYRINEHVAVGFNWQSVNGLGDQNHLGGIDLQILAAGFKYQF